MVVEALAEVHERGDRLIDHLVVELAAGERAVAEPHRHALGLDAHELASAPSSAMTMRIAFDPASIAPSVGLPGIDGHASTPPAHGRSSRSRTDLGS